GPHLHALDPTATGVQVAHHVAHELLRGRDLDLHVRLEDDRPGTPHALLERHRRGDLERHLGRVNLVVRPVDEHRLDVDDRVPGLAARLHRLPDTGLNRRDVLLRNHAADDAVLKHEALTARKRLKIQPDMTVLATTARLPHEAPLD